MNKIIVCGHWHCSALWHEQNPELYEEFGEKANPLYERLAMFFRVLESYKFIGWK